MNTERTFNILVLCLLFVGVIAERVEEGHIVAEQEETLDLLDNDTEFKESDWAIPFSDPQINMTDLDAITIDYKKKVVDYWRNKGGQQRSFKSVQHRFKKVKHRSDLNNWEVHVENGGTRLEKLKFIAKELFRKFKELRMNNKCIHDYDIKRWAMKIARQVGHDTFKASNFWIRN